MGLRQLLCVVGAGLALSSVAHGEPSRLEQARQASTDLNYAEARAHAEAAIASGQLGVDELVEAYALAGDVASVLQDPAAGEAYYRRVLVLRPDHPPPGRSTPVFQVPFARARTWVAAHGSLHLLHHPPTMPPPGRAIVVEVRAVSDPLKMAVGLRIRYQLGADATKTVVSRALQVELAAPTGAVQPAELSYFLEVLDAHGNVLVIPGSAERPFVVALPSLESTKLRPPASGAREPVLSGLHASAPPSRRSSRPFALGAGAVSVLGLAVGVTFDVAYHREFERLQQRCAPGCGPDELTTLHGRERAAVAGYGVAAVAIIVAAAIALLD